MEPLRSIVGKVVLEELSETAQKVPPGDFAEVGVYTGGSAWWLYAITQRQGRKLHLFDTFAGMPFAHMGDVHPIGDFADTSEDEIRKAMPEAILHVGVFPRTLPQGIGPLAFVHVDCDQYLSVSDCISYLWPLVVPGGIMWFDDYFALPGARKAVLEHFKEEELVKAIEGRRYAVKR